MPDLSSVSFLWPLVLYSAILVPVLGIAYAYFTKRFPPIVLSLGLCLLCIAMARPQAVLLTPLREATVMLALDTSGSMRAKDLKPSRIEAAQEAALKFIESKPARLRVGLVTMAGTAALAQSPTEERELQLQTTFAQSGVDALELSTDEDIAAALLKFSELRKRRLWRA